MPPLLAHQLRPVPALPYSTSLQCSLLTFVALYLCRTRRSRRTARAPSPSSLHRCLRQPSVSFVSPPWPPHLLPQHRSVLLAMCLHNRAAAYGNPCVQLCTMLFITKPRQRSIRHHCGSTFSNVKQAILHHCNPAGRQGPGSAGVPRHYTCPIHIIALCRTCRWARTRRRRRSSAFRFSLSQLHNSCRLEPYRSARTRRPRSSSAAWTATR